MSFSAARSAIEQRFTSIWDASEFSQVPIAWDGAHIDESSVEFVTPSVVWGTSTQVTLSNPALFEHFGFFQVLLVTQKGRGSGRLERMAEVLFQGFDRYEVLVGNDCVRFGVRDAPELSGLSTSGSLLQLPFSASFSYDRRKIGAA